jgi:hypothetical protein
MKTARPSAVNEDIFEVAPGPKDDRPLLMIGGHNVPDPTYRRMRQVPQALCCCRVVCRPVEHPVACVSDLLLGSEFCVAPREEPSSGRG